MIKDIRNLFRLRKKAIKESISNQQISKKKHLGTFLSMKKMIITKPIRVGNFWRKHYIEYESNGDRNKTL